MNLIDDSINFEAYLVEPDAKQLVKPASHWRDEVKQSFRPTEKQAGVYLPWKKTRNQFRLRPGELTLWPGINGHGKSVLLSMVMLCAMAQGERVLVASMEMRPRMTLNRMARQTSKAREPEDAAIDVFHDWAEERLWLYDRYGAVKWRHLLAVCRWAVDQLQITHIVIDSLMRCGIPEGDYEQQTAFVDALCTFKHDYGAAVHLVMHSRKKDDEFAPPGKFDAKGAGTMTDLADNIMTVWRNKKKESERQKGGAKDDIIKQPDAMVICDKQRNFDWEEKIGLWYHRDSMQFVEYGVDPQPIELMEWGA
jgi:twinkle protein